MTENQNPIRTAVSEPLPYTTISVEVRAVEAYLSSNFHVSVDDAHRIVIGGRDVAGWTLDAQIERLASGLRFFREVTQ